MLQTKDRAALTKEPVDLIQAVNVAAESLKIDAQVQSFLDEVKLAAKAMSEADGKEILLQRASQSEKMKDLIAKFQALSEEDQDTLTASGGNIFEKLPGGQKTALVEQVSHAMDDSVTNKATTSTYNNPDRAVGGKCTETVDPQTGYRHKHCHGNRGTETTSRAKYGGHEHLHKYTHNGQGGDARTQTITDSGNGHRHEHTHSHVGGNTGTSTKTWGPGHKHTHSHAHLPGWKTATSTGGTGGNHQHETKG